MVNITHKKVAPPLLAGGSVLEACVSPERIAEPGVNKATSSIPGLVEGHPSTAGTNTRIGEVAPSPPR